MNVLIVEDDEDGRRFLRGLVAHHWPDARIIQAVDGKTGLKLFAQQPPGVTFLDIDLPKLNGLDVLEIIRAFRRDAFVVMVSGHSSMDNVKAASELGIDGFLVKPFEEHKVVELLQRYAARHAGGDVSRVGVVGKGKTLSWD